MKFGSVVVDRAEPVVVVTSCSSSPVLVESLVASVIIVACLNLTLTLLDLANSLESVV